MNKELIYFEDDDLEFDNGHNYDEYYEDRENR